MYEELGDEGAFLQLSKNFETEGVWKNVTQS